MSSLIDDIACRLRQSLFALGAWAIVASLGATVGWAQADGAFRWAYLMDRTSMLPLVEASPAIGSDGTVYVGAVFGTNPESGAVVAITPIGDLGAKEKWRFLVPDRIEASPLIGPDGTIYIGCFDGKLYALDQNTGALKWSYDTNLQSAQPTYIHSTASLSRDGSTIYVGVGTFSLDSSAASPGGVFALSTTGQLQWTRWFGDVVESSPVVAPDNTIYVGSWDHNVYALSPEGTIKWSHALDGQIWGSAAIAGDGTIYVGSISNEFVALTPDNQLKWQVAMTTVGSAALGADGTVYVGSWGDSSLYALDPTNGSIKWRSAGQPALGSTPAVRSDGTILFGGEDAVLRAYNRTDGRVLWGYTIPTGGRLLSSTAVAPTADHGIYIGCADGRLYAFHGNGSGLSTYSPWPMFQHDAVHSGSGPDPVNGGQLVNMAARGQAGPGINLIAGFVVQGTGSKPLLIRAVGPTLSLLGVQNPLPNPSVTVHVTSAFAYVNDDWWTNYNADELVKTTAAVGAFPLPDGSRDAAVLANAIIAPGVPVTYTATVDSVDGGTGVALVETYDTNTASSVRLVNLSARGHVGLGENVLIPSLVIGGSGKLRVLVRAVGPGLVQLGVSGVVAQPSLSVYNGQQQVIASNTGWTSGGLNGDLAGAAALVGAFALPDGSADSAMILSLDPGAYTFQVSGVNGGTGEALVEVYALPY